MLIGGPRAARLCLRHAVVTRPRLSQTSPTIRRITPTPSSQYSLPLRNSRPFTISRPLFVGPSKTPDPIIPAAATGTTSIPPVEPPNTNPTTNDSDKIELRRRRRRAIKQAAFFLAIGLLLGTALRLTLQPPSLPLPDSPEDLYLTAKIHEQGASLPIVRTLSSDPAWTSWDAYSGLQPTASQPLNLIKSRITSGPLAGARGLAFQRIFRNAATGEVVSVVYFGPGLAGWPGIVHGGALATILDESLGRCAILKFPARTGVTARLELAYRFPTMTAGFYVVRAKPAVREGEDPAKSDRKMWVDGTLETLKGRVCVEAKALFVVPRDVKLKPLVEKF
ncbi:HotDog domain-containing protein [Hypoxylon trugodes]|uniref:HotDog domain-containing protein n=1 Tax=Hypoxylon trugodes TaxID=326681 RepID=UPI002199204F|nr:HotDog domain-containing protein [Hypoxylon trugodes]KAI1392274.1 HotDog domain-containing protein [Hypoxylon trugodes]